MIRFEDIVPVIQNEEAYGSGRDPETRGYCSIGRKEEPQPQAFKDDSKDPTYDLSSILKEDN